MGSRGGAAAVPASSRPTPVVCCMCGDRGLPQELFRCKICVVRSQHKYCSNLYPRVESYRACNWCLNFEAGNIGKAKEAATTTTDDNSSPVHYPPSSNNDSSSSIVKASSGAFPHHFNKAVKKQKVMQEGSWRSPPNKVKIDRPPMRPEEISPSAGRGKQAFRGKVRRYKLLDEVDL